MSIQDGVALALALRVGECGNATYIWELRVVEEHIAEHDGTDSFHVISPFQNIRCFSLLLYLDRCMK
jgi:hypothetical protein